MPLFYISFANETRFLGATVVEAAHQLDAVRVAWERGLNPGGGAAVIQIPPDLEGAPDIATLKDRLIDEAEMRALGGKKMRELNEDVARNVDAQTTYMEFYD